MDPQEAGFSRPTGGPGFDLAHTSTTVGAPSLRSLQGRVRCCRTPGALSVAHAWTAPCKRWEYRTFPSEGFLRNLGRLLRFHVGAQDGVDTGLVSGLAAEP